MPYQFENWLLTEDKLAHSSNPNFFIEKNTLTTKRNETTYDWMLHIAEKMAVLEKLDIIWFNTAFLFATTYFNIELDLSIFYESILEQKNILNEDFDSSEDEITLGNN